MNLAPLADVVAYLDREPAGLTSMKQALVGRYDVIWSPIAGCLMATRALPRSVPDGEELRNAGSAFAEGRDRLAGRSPTDLPMSSLPGNVGFVRAEVDKLVVVRSGPGTVPWYAWQDGDRALVSTTFTELVRLLPVAPDLDPLVCALWASLWPTFPDARSFLRGVTAIPPGHTAEVRPGQALRCHRWWNPWPDELPWPSRASRAIHVERFRHAVLGGLDREVAEAPVNLLALSGGIDSSVLAYLVCRHLGRPLATLSLVPPEGAPEAALEASYLDPLLAHLDIAPSLRQPMDFGQAVALASGTSFVTFPVLHPLLHVLPRLVPEWGVEILVGGEWADEVCGGWFAYPDWLDTMSLPRLVAWPAALPIGRSDIRAWARRRIPGRPRPGPGPASLSECVRPEVKEEFRTWREGQLRDLWASAAPHRYQRAMLNWLDGALAMNWEVCSFLGVRRAFPFFTAEVLDVVSDCHPFELLGRGPKRLEREAFAGLVPRRYLHRPDKSGWGGQNDKAPVVPPLVPSSLAGVFLDDLATVSPASAAGMAILSRFAARLA